jgi:hypothetical protein
MTKGLFTMFAATIAFMFAPASAGISSLYMSIVSAPVTHAVTTSPNQPGTLDELLVTGERPGPAMWRVSKGDHDLWIVATLSPLPKHMTWRSRAVENRIAKSQVVLGLPEILADVAFFSDPAYAQHLVRAQQIPNRGRLNQLLPNDIYVRWRVLRSQYLAETYDERIRPIVDASHLFQRAVEQSGLTTDDSVWATVKATAHRAHVKIVPVGVFLTMDSPELWIQQFIAIPQNQELDCLGKTIERIETDMEPMRHRANLWSVGDIEALRALKYPDDRITCFNALFSVPQFHSEIGQAVTSMYDKWLTAADEALTQNVSSFAVLPIAEMLQADGWLDRLRARGYSIKEP